MKPRLTYRNKTWYCTRNWITGRGRTPLDAWQEMWTLIWNIEKTVLVKYQPWA